MIKDYDPRLKIILAVIIPFCSFRLTNVISLSINYVIMIGLFLSIGAYKSARKIFAYSLVLFVINYFNNIMFVGVALFFIIKFSPIGIMLNFVYTKMKTGHFIGSMQRIHLPKNIIIIFAVIFRFFPTLKIELNNIKQAMKLRGIHFTFKNLITKPAKTIEFAGIPLVMRSMILSDNLSAASMCRGLDLERKNTSYVDLKLSFSQIIFTILIGGLCTLNLYLDHILFWKGSLP